MLTKVALLNPNGRVGSAALKHLLAAQEGGKIELIALHRPNSVFRERSHYANIETREIDLEGDAASMVEALQGVNVLISAVPRQGLTRQVQLVEAFAKVATAALFIPARYGADWFRAAQELPHMGQILELVDAGPNRARQLGVPVTEVLCGMFAQSFFGEAMLGTDVKRNTIQANAKQLENPFPVTTMDHLGAVLAEIVTRPLSTVVNRRFSAITLKPTGQELADVFAKINGTSPVINDYTHADRQRLLQDKAINGVVFVCYFDYWENGHFEFPNAVEAADRETLEQVVRGYVPRDNVRRSQQD